MKFRLYFFTLIFFLISSSINAKPRCDIFYEKIKNNYDILSLDKEQPLKGVIKYLDPNFVELKKQDC